ncbi:MAG: four helix bundle protein [Armatimonadetes bacterium]|nr:four helix bundle protein [Armatimonadota bacterium]
MSRDVKQLKVWQRAIELCEDVYGCTARFPAAERLGLSAQMRRAAASMPSNLAEGYGRGSRKDYRHFACIARGSAGELETQAIIASRIGFIAPQDSHRLVSSIREVVRMLDGLVRALEP